MAARHGLIRFAQGFAFDLRSLPFATVAEGSIARSAEVSELTPVTPAEGFFLGAGPALELGFAVPGLGEGVEGFDAKQSDRQIECGRAACLTRLVILQSLLQIARAPDINHPGFQAEKVDHRRSDPDRGCEMFGGPEERILGGH